MTETKNPEFVISRDTGQVTKCLPSVNQAIMEAETASISSPDLPVSVSCLFRDKQIVTTVR